MNDLQVQILGALMLVIIAFQISHTRSLHRIRSRLRALLGKSR